MYHVTKYSTIRGVFRGGSNGVCQGLLRLRRHLESGVDPGNEVDPRTIFFLRPEKKSKETYGQTRGLSDLEIKYVGKLVIIGALLKAKQA